MKQSNLDLLPVSELASYLSAFKEGTEWNQMSEVTEALSLSLRQQGRAAPICIVSHRSFFVYSKGSVCKQPSDALLRAVEGLSEIRPTSQRQSHPNSANTDYFCSPHCGNSVLKGFTKRGNQGQVPIDGVARPSAHSHL